MLKPLTPEQLEQMSAGTFLGNIINSGLDPDHGVRFAVTSPCGCVAVMTVHLQAIDDAQCVNAAPAPTNRKEPN